MSTDPTEFEGIFQRHPNEAPSRDVMSPPSRVIASRKFIREVGDVVEAADSYPEIADWVVDKMERYGAASARPVFDMDGNGPQCSWCSTIWPLCGHHHQSLVLDEEADA